MTTDSGLQDVCLICVSAYVFIRAAWGWPWPAPRWCLRMISLWVDHQVEQNNALTCAFTSEILFIASDTYWPGAFKRKRKPSARSHFDATSAVHHLKTIS